MANALGSSGPATSGATSSGPPSTTASTTAGTTSRSVVVAGWTLVSRATGLLRVVVIGAVLGPTYLANTFLTANLVPNLMFSMVAGQALALVLVPALVRAATGAGLRGARTQLGRVSGFLLLASGAVAGLVALAAPAIAWLITLGVPEPELRAQAHEATTVLLWLVAPQILLYTVAAAGAAAQQARQRYALAGAAPAVENLVLIGAVLLVGTLWRPGLEVDQAPTGLLITLGAGSTLAVAVHAGVQVFGAYRAGMPLRPVPGWRSDPVTVEVVRRLRSSLTVPAATSMAMFTLLVVAATVPGGTVVVQAAYTVYLVPTALGARAVATAVLPGLSAASERGDQAGFAAGWRQALAYATMTSLPMLVLLGMLAHPAADMLANGELRSELLIEQLATCLAVMAVAQVAAATHEVGRQALFARIDIEGPRRASLTALSVTVLLSAASLMAPAGTTRLALLGCALLVGELAGATCVLARLRAALHPERLVDAGRLLAAIVAAGAMWPVVVGGSWVWEAFDAGRFADGLVLGGCGLVALAVYVAVLCLGIGKLGGRQLGRRPS